MTTRIFVSTLAIMLTSCTSLSNYVFEKQYDEEEVTCRHDACFDSSMNPLTGTVTVEKIDCIEKNKYKNGRIVSSHTTYLNDKSDYSGVEHSIYAINEFNNEQEISIDTFNQIKQILNDGAKKYKAKAASYILMDASDSTILSSYTTNEASQTYLYEPGSVMKVFTVAMGLESKKIKADDKVDASKPLKLKYNTIRDYRGENRELTIAEVLQYSSNIGAAQIALKVGGKEQRKFLSDIGITDAIDDYGVNSLAPILPKRWGEGTAATVAYGYGLVTSPLHIVTAYSAIINGGVYYKPSFERIENKDRQRIISASNSRQMRKYLRNVVVNGTAKRADIKDIKFMAKTGTANKLNDEGKYVDGKVRTTVVGNFDLNGKQYAILVLFNEPQGLEETWGFITAGWNAVPTAREIIETIAEDKINI